MQWKRSPIDEVAVKHWDDYSEARNQMFARTSSPLSPWIVVRADDKRSTRLNVIRDLIARLHTHEWVVYAKQPLGGPVQVLEYLGRYTHRVAISNERIVGMDEDSVSLRVRDWTQGNRRRTLRLPAQASPVPRR